MPAAAGQLWGVEVPSNGLASGALELRGPRLLPMDSDSPNELVFELGFSEITWKVF